MAGLSGPFEYISARWGTVSDVAPAAASQRNSCEMSRHGTHASKIRGLHMRIGLLDGLCSFWFGERQRRGTRHAGWTISWMS